MQHSVVLLTNGASPSRQIHIMQEIVCMCLLIKYSKSCRCDLKLFQNPLGLSSLCWAQDSNLATVKQQQRAGSDPSAQTLPLPQLQWYWQEFPNALSFLQISNSYSCTRAPRLLISSRSFQHLELGQRRILLGRMRRAGGLLGSPRALGSLRALGAHSGTAMHCAMLMPCPPAPGSPTVWSKQMKAGLPEVQRGSGMPEEDRGSLKREDALYSFYSVCFQITADAFVSGQQFKTAPSGITACQVSATTEYGRANVPSSLGRGGNLPLKKVCLELDFPVLYFFWGFGGWFVCFLFPFTH